MDGLSKDELLRILDAHGQQFLQRFSVLGKRESVDDLSDRPTKVSRAELSDGSEPACSDSDEWDGISNVRNANDSDDAEEEFEQEDDDFTGSSNLNPNTVFFADQTVGANGSTSRPHSKAFMSSKVSKLRDDSGPAQPKTTRVEVDDDQTNTRNDAILHRLIHTKLLSGSLNPGLDLTPAQRRMALAGRVLELSGSARLGKGEKQVRIVERNKAAKRVREGILEKQKQREMAQLDEAKNLGNYHPTIKKVFAGSEDSKPSKKRRERGLKMGVGKFRGGMLRLSKEEISVANRSHTRSRGGRTQRGRGRGRGRRP